MWDLALLLMALLGLWAGTELAVSGALRLCERYGLSQGFVGLTVLAIGTDLPELVVALSGGVYQLRGVETSGVVVGNATGSAIAQGALVLGIAGLVGPLVLPRRMMWRDGLTVLFAGGLLGLLAWDGRISRLDGAALLLVYALYYGWLTQTELGEPRDAPPPVDIPGAGLAWMSVAGGLAAIAIAAHVVVDHAVLIASRWGVSQVLIGVFLVGAGTSLPELVLSVGAAAKGHARLSVGNVIGSNIFDLLVPLGVSALLHPVVVGHGTVEVDLPFVAVATLVALFCFTWRRGLQRGEAGVLLGLYVLYALVRVTLETGAGAAG